MGGGGYASECGAKTAAELFWWWVSEQWIPFDHKPHVRTHHHHRKRKDVKCAVASTYRDCLRPSLVRSRQAGRAVSLQAGCRLHAAASWPTLPHAGAPPLTAFPAAMQHRTQHAHNTPQTLQTSRRANSTRTCSAVMDCSDMTSSSAASSDDVAGLLPVRSLLPPEVPPFVPPSLLPASLTSGDACAAAAAADTVLEPNTRRFISRSTGTPPPTLSCAGSCGDECDDDICVGVDDSEDCLPWCPPPSPP